MSTASITQADPERPEPTTPTAVAVVGDDLAACAGAAALLDAARLGALVGAAFVEGRGFARDQRVASLDLGGVPWARVGARLAAVPVTVWLGGGAMIWAREQRVFAEGVPGAASLPRLDAMLGGGIAWTPDGHSASGH